MRSVLFQAICRTGIFMICAQAIVHFRPQESYEKYLKLLVSVMVLIQLFLPLGSFLAGIGKKESEGYFDNFSKSLEQSMEDARRQAEEMDAILEQMTLEEVRRRMETQADRDVEAQTPQQDGRSTDFQTPQQDGRAADSHAPQQDGQITDSTAGRQTEGIAVELEDIAVEIDPVEQITEN